MPISVENSIFFLTRGYLMPPLTGKPPMPPPLATEPNFLTQAVKLPYFFGLAEKSQ